ncbi:MAG: tetratricopeptide repeat protein [Sphingomonadaceae bacterium]|uniref:tetratricopeptide repeat protein n=1 Tax=Thermaurantiacus sp. TaxID=2820283 RepID=UPI00298F3A95|nr:tetratricopeptide repeat protein [Thermaurantiacus sp.]MCS6985968.1 tetratricopeptide repeat protein [Sphingomonadaceae bacterium]MDW8414816.1 tetratricopeptide repeat protein [Thermaurantiacus sp.]
MRRVAVVLALALAAPAQGAVTIIGGGLARECYLAAEFRQERSLGVEVCTRALQTEPLKRRDRAATLVNRGILHMQARDFDRALADYDAALRLMPELAEAHVNKGIALLHRGGADREAVAALTRGLELGPSRPEVAFYTRAVAHEILGNARAAYEDYQAALAARPGWEEPIEQLKRFTVQRVPAQRG